MAQLVTLSKLAKLVSENTGIEIAICEAFIRNLAQTAANGLTEGEHIRIKDFGLFELRHNADGEATVEFVPETSFAERVNAPYANLRPAIVSRPQGTNPPVQNPAMPQAPAYPPQPEAPAYTCETPMPQAPAYPPQPEAPAYTRETPMPQAPAYPPQPEVPAYQSQTPDFPHSPTMPSPQQNGTPDLPSYLNLPGLGKTDPDPASDTFPPEKPQPQGFNRPLPQLSTNKKYALIGVLGLFVGFILGYLTGRYPSDSDEVTPEARQVVTDIKPEATEPPVEQEFDNEPALSVADVDTLMTDDEEEEIDTPETPAPPQIITVKLQKGQRLSDIAQKHYGKKEFWVYIYLENRESISNPTTVREGAVLRIPPKDKYAPTTDEATNLAWAKNKAAEINSKYRNK